MSNGFEEYIFQAQQCAEQGDFDGAIEYYKMALEMDPTNEEIRRDITNLTLQKGDFQGTIIEYFDWAEACQIQGAIDDAIRIYQEILGLDTLLQKKIFMMDQEVAGETIAQIRETIQSASGAIFFNLGYLYLEKGALDEAVSCLVKSMEYNPSDAKTHTLLGQVYMQKNMDSQAIGEFQEVVRLAPDDSGYAYEMLGEIFLRSGKPPQSTVVWFKNAGEQYLKHEQAEEALRVFERVLTVEPKNKEVLSKLAELYTQFEQKEQTIEVFKKLAEVFSEEGLPDKVVSIYEKLVEWDPENNEIREKLVAIYRQTLEMEPSNLTARHKLIGNLLRRGAAEEAIPEFLALSETYMQKGMKKEAFSVCRKLLELDPVNPKAHEIIADILLGQDKQEEALKEYMVVIKLHLAKGEEESAQRMVAKISEKFPQNKEVGLQMALFYKEKGEFDSALLEFQKVLSEDPYNTDLLSHVLEIYEARDENESVIQLAERIMQIDSSKMHAMREKILTIHEKLGNKQKLVEMYNQILKEDPSRFELRQKILKIYEEMGNQEKIIEMYSRILESEPERTDIRKKLIEYYAEEKRIKDVLRESSILADIYMKQDEMESAEELYKSVLAFMPDDITIRDRMCSIYERRGDKEKLQEEIMILAHISFLEGDLQSSLGRYNKLLELDPSDINIKKKIAIMARSGGDYREAVSQYKDIAEVYLQKNMTDSALGIIGNILEIDTEDIEYRKKMIGILKEQLRVKEAVDNYKLLILHFLGSSQLNEANVSAREAIALQPMDLGFRKEIVELFLQGGDLESARRFSDELVDIYVNRSDYGEVVGIYDRLSQVYKETNQSEIYYELREKIAQIYEKQVRFHEAIEEYLLILEGYLMDSNHLEAERFFPMLMNLYFKEERAKDGADSFKFLGERLYKAGKLDETVMTLEQVETIQEKLEDWDQALDTLHLMARYLDESEEPQRVVKTRRRCIEIYLKQRKVDKAISEMFNIIKYHLGRGDIDTAMEQFEEIENFEPDDPGIIFRMAELLFHEELYDRSLPLYERVLEKEPENYDAMARVAIMYAKSGNLQDAVSFTKKIFSKGLVAEVLEEYKKSSGLMAEDPQLHINLGLFYQEMGFIEEAIMEFDLASRDPERLLESYNLMALCFKKEGLTELAIRQFERALEQPGYEEEDYLDIRYNLGELYLDQLRYQDALSAFYECYMVDINYRDVSEKIAMLNDLIAGMED